MYCPPRVYLGVISIGSGSVLRKPEGSFYAQFWHESEICSCQCEDLFFFNFDVKKVPYEETSYCDALLQCLLVTSNC